MATIKRRGKRVGPKHRMWITLALPTVEALRTQSEKIGYSVSALAQQVIDRGVAAGLLYADTPSPQGEDVVRVTQAEHYYQLSEELVRLQEDHIKILQDRVDLKEQMIAHMQQGLEDYAETITQQARDIDGYEHARIEAADGVALSDVRQELESSTRPR